MQELIMGESVLHGLKSTSTVIRGNILTMSSVAVCFSHIWRASFSAGLGAVG